MLSFKRPLIERKSGIGAGPEWKPQGRGAGGGRGQGTVTRPDRHPHQLGDIDGGPDKIHRLPTLS